MDVKGSRRVSRSAGGRQPERGVGECGVAGAKGLDPVAGRSLGARLARMRPSQLVATRPARAVQTERSGLACNAVFTVPVEAALRLSWYSHQFMRIRDHLLIICPSACPRGRRSRPVPHDRNQSSMQRTRGELFSGVRAAGPDSVQPRREPRTAQFVSSNGA